MWICIPTPSKTYIQYCPFNVYLTNNEPGTTIHILYEIIIFKLLLIHVIKKLGVYYYKRFFFKTTARHACNNILHLTQKQL